MEVSEEQIVLNEYYEGNNREVQPLGERLTLKYEEYHFVLADLIVWLKSPSPRFVLVRAELF